MIGAFLQQRRLRKTFCQSCVVLIRMQFVISQKPPEENTEDLWALGYVYGATTAILQRIGLEPNPDTYKILAAGYAAIFDNEAIGKQVLANSMDLRSESLFAEAQEIGGNELLHSQPGGPAPFALGAYLGDNKSDAILSRIRKWAKE